MTSLRHVPSSYANIFRSAPYMHWEIVVQQTIHHCLHKRDYWQITMTDCKHCLHYRIFYWSDFYSLNSAEDESIHSLLSFSSNRWFVQCFKCRVQWRNATGRSKWWNRCLKTTIFKRLWDTGLQLVLEKTKFHRSFTVRSIELRSYQWPSSLYKHVSMDSTKYRVW